ncbi:MAG: FcoT family thioesterase [Phormidesmis sp.]
MDTNRAFSRAERVSKALLERFLSPYKADCQYLKSAQFYYPPDGSPEKSMGFIKGDFAIEESCYIDDTGHFNSVEFNICYNQIFYVLIAYLLQNHLLLEMSDWDLELYKRRQLSDFLITRFSSTFRKPVDASAFQGMLSIDKCAARSGLVSVKTSCAFYDENGWSEGQVTVCVVDTAARRAKEARQAQSANYSLSS